MVAQGSPRASLAGLQFGLTIIVESACPSCPFAIGEHGPGHFEFSKFVGNWHQSLGGRFSFRQPIQTVPEREERIERSKPLRLHNRTHAVGQQLAHLPAIGTRLPRSRKEGDEFVFREVVWAVRVVHES